MTDLSYLRQLLGGDERMVARFLEAFKTEVPRQLELLSDALRTGDRETANITAHAIKGQLKYLGQESLAAVAYQIEQRTEAGSDLQTAAELLSALREGLEGLLKEI